MQQAPSTRLASEGPYDELQDEDISNSATRYLHQLTTTQLLQENVDRLSLVQDALISQV